MNELNLQVLVKRMTASELGWFAECRKLGTSRGNQRGINLDAPLVRKLFNDELLSKGHFKIYATYQTPDCILLKMRKDR